MFIYRPKNFFLLKHEREMTRCELTLIFSILSKKIGWVGLVLWYVNPCWVILYQSQNICVRAGVVK